MIHFWHEQDKKELKVAKSFAQLLPIAIRIIKRMSQPVAMVSGPISTGGLGSVEKNMKFFTLATAVLYKSGVNVFDQTPFDWAMERIKKNTWHKKEYCIPLLEDFYLPLFKNKIIQEVYFLPDWQSSFGAKWEHQQCEKFNIEIHDFPKEILNRNNK